MVTSPVWPVSSQFGENLLTPSTTTRVRGLSHADNTRDYFLTDIPWDSFNVGRVDISRGPNSILFGNGSPGGIINNDVNDAEFTNATNFTNRVEKLRLLPQLGRLQLRPHPEHAGHPRSPG